MYMTGGAAASDCASSPLGSIISRMSDRSGPKHMRRRIVAPSSAGRPSGDTAPPHDFQKYAYAHMGPSRNARKGSRATLTAADTAAEAPLDGSLLPANQLCEPRRVSCAAIPRGAIDMASAAIEPASPFRRTTTAQAATKTPNSVHPNACKIMKGAPPSSGKNHLPHVDTPPACISGEATTKHPNASMLSLLDVPSNEAGPPRTRPPSRNAAIARRILDAHDAGAVALKETERLGEGGADAANFSSEAHISTTATTPTAPKTVNAPAKCCGHGRGTMNAPYAKMLTRNAAKPLVIKKLVPPPNGSMMPPAAINAANAHEGWWSPIL